LKGVDKQMTEAWAGRMRERERVLSRALKRFEAHMRARPWRNGVERGGHNRQNDKERKVNCSRL
jgi:hypothetical protein